jgi:hypothetical protein
MIENSGFERLCIKVAMAWFEILYQKWPGEIIETIKKNTVWIVSATAYILTGHLKTTTHKCSHLNQLSR